MIVNKNVGHLELTMTRDIHEHLIPLDVECLIDDTDDLNYLQKFVIPST